MKPYNDETKPPTRDTAAIDAMANTIRDWLVANKKSLSIVQFAEGGYCLVTTDPYIPLPIPIGLIEAAMEQP